jgi:hypothetical protein
MSEKKDRTESVGTVLRGVLKRIDSEESSQAFAVWSIWSELVGETLARRAQPSSYRNGVLFVTVGAHSWMQELQFMKETLRRRLNARLGRELIRDIDFVSGVVEPPRGRDDPKAVIDQTADAAPPISLPELADPELAATFERLVRAHARRGRRPKGPRRR